MDKPTSMFAKGEYVQVAPGYAPLASHYVDHQRKLFGLEPMDPADTLGRTIFKVSEVLEIVEDDGDSCCHLYFVDNVPKLAFQESFFTKIPVQ